MIWYKMKADLAAGLINESELQVGAVTTSIINNNSIVLTSFQENCFLGYGHPTVTYMSPFPPCYPEIPSIQAVL